MSAIAQLALAVLAAGAAFLFYEAPGGLTLGLLVFLFIASVAPRPAARK